jgi:hypothetical protein
MVDSFVQLRTAESAQNGSAQSGKGVEVVDPDGKRPLSLSEASTIQSYQLTKSGFYQLRYANGKDAVVGVNPDRRESDLEVIADDVLGLWSGSGNPGGQPAESPVGAVNVTKEAPLSLWWWVMLLALAVAVAESMVGAGYLGTQREEA